MKKLKTEAKKSILQSIVDLSDYVAQQKTAEAVTMNAKAILDLTESLERIEALEILESKLN